MTEESEPSFSTFGYLASGVENYLFPEDAKLCTDANARRWEYVIISTDQANQRRLDAMTHSSQEAQFCVKGKKEPAIYRLIDRVGWTRMWPE